MTTNFFYLSLLFLFLDPGSEIWDPGSGMGKNQGFATLCVTQNFFSLCPTTLTAQGHMYISNYNVPNVQVNFWFSFRERLTPPLPQPAAPPSPQPAPTSRRASCLPRVPPIPFPASPSSSSTPPPDSSSGRRGAPFSRNVSPVSVQLTFDIFYRHCTKICASKHASPVWLSVHVLHSTSVHPY